MFQSLPLILFNLLLATSIISASFDVSPPLPPLVAVITFHYSEARIPHLVAALNNLDSYPSQMETIIVTNDGESTQKAIGRRRGVGVRVPPKPLIASDPHKLTWYHRQIFQERRVTKSSQDVIYLYLEDDIIVPHDTLRYFSENADRVFEKLGLILGFYRIDGDEVPSKGWLTDQFRNCDNEVFNPKDTLVSIEEEHFVQLHNPYSACYAVTGRMLDVWARLPEFEVRHQVFLNKMDWETRELAASGMQFSDWGGAEKVTSRGSSMVVPADEEGNLRDVGKVLHMDVSKTEPNYCWYVNEVREGRGREL